jgi:hypothetical protein
MYLTPIVPQGVTSTFTAIPLRADQWLISKPVILFETRYPKAFHGPNCLFSVVNTRVCHCQPCLIFAGKAGAYLSGASSHQKLSLD